MRRLFLFQDNWVTPITDDEQPDGELASSLTQLAHRCMAYLNKVRYNLTYDDLWQCSRVYLK